MADVPGKFFSATKVRTGVAPSSSGSIVGEPLPPVNPPGSSLNSVGLTMPSAFTVSNSPLTANGTIGVAGAGTVGQYIRGDGSLADFPQASGGGSSVSYYLNGSISQGTIGGVAYKELNKVPILGAGTDFTINADGYIASFITDAGDPSLLEIPGGNWNFETYFSASSSGGTPTFYVELYKVSSGGTATLIASSSSSPELIAFGTNLNPYFSTLAVPTTTLALTDRLAVRFYVTHSGRTITMHTENNTLCQIVTTFTTGLTSLNGLTAQVQNLAVGTSGTDFNIASATATHTFNLPTASATNRGALSSSDWSLFTQAYNDKINSAAVTGTTTKTLTLTQQDGGTITASWSDLNTDAVLSVFGRTGAVVAANGDYTTAQVTESGNLYYTEARVSANTDVAANTAARHNAVTLGTANGLSLSTQVLSLGLASGSTTGALSSTDWTTFNNKQNALGYVPVPETRTITINGTSQDLSANRTYNVGTVTSVAALTLGTSGTDLSSTVANSTTTPVITLNVPTASATNRGALSAADWTTFNNKQNALTLTTTGTSGAATLVGSTLNIPQYQAAGTYVTAVTASSPLASSGGTTPNITIQQASSSQSGFLSSTDWTTFNNKQNALTNPVTGTGSAGQVAYWSSSSAITGESNLFWDATNDRLGIGSSATPTPVAGVKFPLLVTSDAVTRIRIDSTQATPNAGVGLYANGVQKFSFAMFGTTSDFTIYNDALLSSSILVKGDTNNILINDNNDLGQKLRLGGRFALRASATASATTQVPVFVSDPSSTTTELLTRTPAQFRSDIGAQAALTNPVTGTGSAGQVAYWSSSSAITGESNLFWDSTNDRLGIGIAVPTNPLHIVSNTLSQLNIQASSGNTNAQINLEPTGTGIALIGPANNVDFAFRTNASPRMTITSGGNVLIGTQTDSGYKLDVNGTGRFTSNLYTSTALYINTTAAYGFRINSEGNNGFYNRGGSTVSHYPFLLENSSGALLFQVQGTGAATFSSSVTANGLYANAGNSARFYRGANDAYWAVFNDSNNYLNFGTFLSNGTAYGTNPKVILLDNGNVGIGTNSPNYLLHIAAGAANPQLQFTSTGTGSTTSDGFHIGVNNSTLNAFLLQKENADLQILTNDTERMRITSGGNVGIGTPSPVKTLEVRGTLAISNSALSYWYMDRDDSDGRFKILDNSNNDRFNITTGGNVLIGTTTDNGSKLRVNGSLALPHVTKSANYTLDGTDYTVGFDCASNRTATLPDATTCSGRIYVIYQYNTGSGARSVTLDGNGSQTINGATTYSLYPYCDFTSVMIQSNGSNWIIIASNLTADCL